MKDEANNSDKKPIVQNEEQMTKIFNVIIITREYLEILGYDASVVDDEKMIELGDEITEALDQHLNKAIRVACDSVGIEKHSAKSST